MLLLKVADFIIDLFFMPTKPRKIYPGNVYHAYNRATEKRTIFYIEKDYNYFLEKIYFYQEKTKVKILAYAIMPNHWHFMLQEPENLTRRVSNLKYQNLYLY